MRPAQGPRGRAADVVAARPADDAGDEQEWPADPQGLTDAGTSEATGLGGLPAAGLSRRVAARNAAAFAPSRGPSAASVQKARAAGLAKVGRQVARRFSWGLADQAVSSLTNSAVSIYILHELGAMRSSVPSVSLT